jgi:glucose-6-phosphate isomerase
MEDIRELTKSKKPAVRLLKEMGGVIYDKDFAQKNSALKLYCVFRNIKKYKDLHWDITVIFPKMLGKEFVKTKGNKNEHGFRELYTVLEGEAIFLMQKAENGTVEDVFAVKSAIGDWIIVPPNYEIITINSSNEKTLKIGNWVSEKTKNIYKDIEKFGGACYFYTVDGWIKNKKYKNIPELRFEKPLKNMPEDMDFLRKGEIK